MRYNDKKRNTDISPKILKLRELKKNWAVFSHLFRGVIVATEPTRMPIGTCLYLPRLVPKSKLYIVHDT